MNDEFYIGYLPKAPAGLARTVKRTVAAVLLGAVALAAILVVAQNPFPASVFEFGINRTFEGTIQLRPYPALLVGRPGTTEQNASFSHYLLVAPGKHGADELVTPFDRQRVKLEGQLIYRDTNAMIEVRPGSILAFGEAQASTVAEDLGEAMLTGEIIDTKCYFGVMNPGAGKVHRECAARCISGGIPPAFLARNTAQVYLLIDTTGRALDRRVMKFAAEPMTIHGRAAKVGDTFFLVISPEELSRKSRGL